MLSLESEKKLASLLLQYLNCEKTVEKSRQSLSGLPNFDVFSVFRLIDTETNGKISIADLQKFLQRRSVSITRLNLELLITQYDSDFDGKLGLNEFQAFVLPSEELGLREEVFSRNIYPPSLYIESSVARHIVLEASFQGQLETFKRNLFIRNDFSAIDAFRAVDVSRSNFISKFALNDFFKKHQLAVDFEDLEGLIRRIDVDGDLELSYEEFVAGILPANRNAIKRPSSPRKRPQTRVANRPHSTSPTKPPQRSTSVLAKSVRTILFRPSGLQEILEILTSQIYLERQNEGKKNLLCKHPDFNIPDLFKILNSKNSLKIDCSDLERFLRELQIPFHVDEIYLLLRRYSINSSLKIGYSDIEKIFIPYGKVNTMVSRRKARAVFDGFRTFSADTLNDLVGLVKEALRGENHSECLRKRVSAMPWIDLYGVFQELDKDKDESLSQSDLKVLMDEHSINADKDDVNLLIRRYHKGVEFQISYSDFIQELTPKLYN